MRSVQPSLPRRGFASLTFAAVVGLVAACGGGTPQASADGVAVTLRDFSVTVGSSTLPAGSNKLAIQNAGATVHELEVFTVPAGVDPAAIPVVNSVADTASVGMNGLGAAVKRREDTHKMAEANKAFSHFKW